MGVYDPNYKTLVGNKSYTDPEGLTVRNVNGAGYAPAASGGAVSGRSSGRTRGGAQVTSQGDGRVDPTQVHGTSRVQPGNAWTGTANVPPLPTPADFAARASATAASGAAARDAAGAGVPQPPNPYGTESGNTYLEDRYLQRLYGVDKAYNYAAKRGAEALGNRSAAAGSFNSGAARQQEGDYMANLAAQTQGQLDQLAAGASGARQSKTDSMFRNYLGLAGGQSGINSAYDLAGGKAMSDALAALLGYTTNKAGVDGQSNQQGINNIISAYSAY